MPIYFISGNSDFARNFEGGGEKTDIGGESLEISFGASYENS